MCAISCVFDELKTQSRNPCVRAGLQDHRKGIREFTQSLPILIGEPHMAVSSIHTNEVLISVAEDWVFK